MATPPGIPTGAFPKEERLCKKKAFAYLFEHGSSIRVGVLSCLYTVAPSEGLSSTPISVGFAVPKRKFKHAVMRNLLKRRLREAYRAQRGPLQDLLQASNQQVLIMLIYQSNQELPFQQIDQAVKHAFRKLIKRLPPITPAA